MNGWPALVLPVSLGAICFAARRGEGWRDAFVRGTVVLGVSLAAGTEILSATNAVRFAPLLVFWLVLTAAALSITRGRGPLRFSRPDAWEWLSCGAIAAIAGVTLLIALVSPPNSSDAMAYHLPRVVYWAQAGNVRFFPTVYFNQLMLAPLAEYFMLHTWVLSGGDRFVNLVQWLGFFGSSAAVSLVAGELGAGRRGQAIAALLASTLPNGILQASGAKNDALLALWLAAMVYFALRWRRSGARLDLVFLGAALALALFTKATGWLYAPPLLVALLGPRLLLCPFQLLTTLVWRSGGAAPHPPPRAGLSTLSRATLAAPVLAAAVLLVNGPQFARNLALSGSPLGYDSAQGDGFFRWRNERFGWRETVSNVLRNLSDQSGARSERWNRAVYDAVVRLHRMAGIAVDHPATTWPGTKFEPPRNANHETNAANRWHLLLAAVVAVWAAATGRLRLLAYLGALAAGFLLFCFYLKWQPFLSRLFLPLFVCGAAAGAVALERLRPAALQALVCLFLLNNTRPYLFENWVRPLKGPRSVLKLTREQMYFSDMSQWNNREDYVRSAALLARSPCAVIGIDISELQLEYPAQALIRARKPGAIFVHTGVFNASSRYAANQPWRPCAVVCLDCAGKPAKERLYAGYGEPAAAGRFLVFGGAAIRP